MPRSSRRVLPALAVVLLVADAAGAQQRPPPQQPPPRTAQPQTQPQRQRARPRPRPRAPRPDARAEVVERSLLPVVRVAGREYVARTIPERLRDLGVPAVSVAVIDSGRIMWARAWGLRDVEAGDSATAATLFQAASISKPVAATAVLQLAREQKISLDAPANTYLATWKIPDNAFTASRPVTVRHLLTHTGGLTVHGFPGYARGREVPTTPQVLDGTAPANTRAVRVDTTPGVRWRYSGGGITVLQQLVEDVEGRPFAAVMHDRVLKPAGMSSSTFAQPLPEEREREAATGYRADGNAVPGRFHTYPELAAAGLWTTPTDLARWVLDVQKALRGEKGALLDAPTAHAMVTRGLGDWGLGVAVTGARDSLVFSHGGANEGYRARLVGFVGRGRGLVVMTNSDAGGAIAEEIALAVHQTYGWPGMAPRVITPSAVTEEELQALVGTYRNRSGVTAQISLDATRMLLTRSTGGRWEVIPTAPDRLESPEGPVIRLERDQQGRPRALLFGGDRFERTR